MYCFSTFNYLNILETMNLDIENSDSDSDSNSDYDKQDDLRIESQTQNYELRSFYDRFLKNNKIKLDPIYQRDFSWNEDKQNLFVDSLIRGYIIPNIILRKLDKKDEYEFECVDGQHRLKVIKHYIESKKLNDNWIRWNCRDEQTNKKKNIFYADDKNSGSCKVVRKGFLQEQQKSRFDGYTLNVTIITNKLTEDQMCGIFSRLQNGERINRMDKFKNKCTHPLIQKMKQEHIFSLDILSTNPWLGFVEKYKHSSIILTKLREKTALVTFIMRWSLLSHYKSLDCGSYLDLNIEKYFSDNIIKIQIDSIDKIFENLKEFIQELTKCPQIKLCKYIMIILAYLYITSKQQFKQFINSIDVIVKSKYNNYETYEFDEIKNKKCVTNHKKLETVINEINDLIKYKNTNLMLSSIGKKKLTFTNSDI